MKDGEFDQTVFLVQLSQHVPTTFKHHRVGLIRSIINTVFATSYDADMIKLLLAEVDELPSITKQLCGLPSEQILWNVSYTVSNFCCTYMITCS